jgi:hypothetical protein
VVIETARRGIPRCDAWVLRLSGLRRYDSFELGG